MKKAFRLFALLLVPALAVSLAALLAACGGEDEPSAETAKLTATDPKDGSEVAEGAFVTLTFDIDPGEVMANGVKAEGSGLTRKIKADKATIALTWANGGAGSLTFKLLPPDKAAPTLTASTPKDGATDVDPADANKGVVLEFSENVTKVALKLSSEGADLGWLAQTKDNKVTLTPPKGKEAVNEKSYEVTGTVEDAAGNKKDVKITFKTKAKQ